MNYYRCALLFSDAIVDLTGNDTWYELSIDDLYSYVEDGFVDEHRNEVGEELYNKRLSRGHSNCYYDDAKMREFCSNPIGYKEAVTELVDWLKKSGVKKSDTVFCKIWW